MSTPFLYRFSAALVSRLVVTQRLEVSPGAEDQVARFVAGVLGGAGEGASLISTLSGALLGCPQVEELYADEEELKELVSDLGG